MQNLFKFLFLLALSLYLISCGHVKTRTQINKETQETARTSPYTNEIPVDAPQPIPVAPKVKPKLGLILGPGLMKTFAHLGVLKKIEEARIPISYIAGMEWGALMAGLYAQEGTTRHLEWKLYKFKTESLFQSGWLSFSQKTKSPNWFDSYLDENLSDRRAEIPFYCPALSLKRNQVVWLNAANNKKDLKKCLAYPPLFSPYQGWVAGAFSLNQTADFLRKKGAEVIVLINVLGGSKHIEPKAKAKDFKSSLIWSELARVYNTDQNLINTSLDIRTSGLYISDSDKRKEFIKLGERLGEKLVKELLDKYNF